MFRTMRRSPQALSPDEIRDLLKKETRGVLSVQGDDGYPYGVPINHYYDEETNRLYFHGANFGHRVDAVKRDPKVSYCVYGGEYQKEGDWARYVKSVIIFGKAVLIGLLGAVIGSIVSTRLMIAFSAKQYGKDAWMPEHEEGVDQKKEQLRPIRAGNVANRFLSAILDGGKSGVRMGFEIIPGVLLICTLVLMMTNGMPEGGYTGAAYEGVALLPRLAGKIDFILKPLFGFSSPEAIGVPITALGAAGASLTMARQLVVTSLAGANDIAVFTAMCMCWSGYLSTHVSMMSTIGCTEMTGKALVSHTVGGLVAGITAHWLFVLVSLIL